MTTSTAPNPTKRGMPVTIITGFLGSGKTTLLNHILSNNKDLKVAILVNEFGDINIDSQLLVTMDEDMVELSNGCICCTINDDLVDAVYRIMERQDQVDYMVIETTGVADPVPIILTFLGTELRDLTRLDSIIAMVDAETFTPDHFESEAALKQITYSDVTIVNKVDLAPTDQVKELEKYLSSIKERARILHSQQGQVPLQLILDVGYNNPEDYAGLEHDHHGHDHHDHHGHDNHHDHHDHDHGHHGHHHGHHGHDHHHSAHLDNDGFVSIAFESDRPFQVAKFEHFLQNNLPKTVFRGKGILWFKESDLRNIFQLSGPRFSIDGEEWSTPPRNQLVLIGRHLNGDDIQQQLTACLA
ncbi:CobW family GTP-binding protein [Leptothoe kymatousa]|uniref:GTP-binding protein n=1 Tax=Leptothoe kymatousa TAU-MAC 1615 TaxID=2364775 RepID=A0ABS5Y8F5_9CYAN|nr:GTP-binding protein [Leptothoe kymatousa]MBT9313225.1 GTP-binding protein [Leptothoe kymatousa TAU-MAC 1615]